ncbi:MAG: hypothetical protein E6Q51_01070, partial [Methylophilus methylotrophus]
MSLSIKLPGYWKRLWILYGKEWFRIKRNPAALMAAGLIVLMAFLVSIENRANQIAKRQEQLPCGVVYALETELIQSLSAQAAYKVQAVFNPREERRVWLDMAQKNAQLQLMRLLSEEGSQRERTRALAEALD